jgi:hypothetical protein
MKISHKDLEGLYKSYLEDRLPVSRAKCPSPQDITACLRGEGLKNRRNRIIDHIFQCAYCHEEFEFILKTIREEKKFIHDLSSITKEKKLREKNKFFYQLLPLHPAWMYGLIFITGVVMISLLVKNISEERINLNSNGNMSKTQIILSSKFSMNPYTLFGKATRSL